MSNKAKFAEIKEYITENIESGEWPEHTKVPSENKLASLFSVSRMTARRALQELSDAGILIRTQGSGSFVASLKSQSSLLEIKNISQEIHDRHKNYTAVVRTLEAIEAIPPVAIAVGLEPGSTVFHSVITHFEGDTPIQAEQRFVNPEFAPDYLQQDFTQVTPHEYLCEAAPLTEARHIVEAVMPSEQMKAWLEMIHDEPCLQIKRRTWSKKGVVSFATLVHPGSRYRLGGHLTFNRK